MTINDPVKFCASLWDWGVLDGCFGDTKIKVMDIDGFVERKGKKIFIEAKLPGVPIPLGEEITYKSLVHDDGHTVIVVWGKPGNPVKIKLMTPKIEKIYENATLETFRNIVSQWFKWANSEY